METLERATVQTIEEEMLGKNHLDQIVNAVATHVKEQHRHASRAAIVAQIAEADETLAWLGRGENPPTPIKAQINEWEKKRDRLRRDLQDAPADASAEAEAAKVRDLLQRVLNPHVLHLPNLVTGNREPLVIRDTRSLVTLLKRDLDAGRAVLRSLLEGVILRPVDDAIEVEIQGTLRGLLTADGVVPFSESTDPTREVVLCGNLGAGRGI